jgi:hypothetical protein
MSASLQPVFLRLRSILEEHRAGFIASRPSGGRSIPTE